jgi:HAD superfamily hydrolase (TIGR01509 family)
MELSRTRLAVVNAPALLRHANAVLLDFDGPVCGVFAGYPAPEVAERLRQLLRAQGITVSPAVEAIEDPMEFLRISPRLGSPRLVDLVEMELRAAELSAVMSAVPSNGSDDFIVAAAATGRHVAIVSNNSAEAIRLYLDIHGLLANISKIVGRKFGRPDLMKPDRAPVVEAMRALDITPERCVLIGDSDADIAAARAARTSSIGVANRPGKREALARAGAGATVADLAELVAVLKP